MKLHNTNEIKFCPNLLPCLSINFSESGSCIHYSLIVLKTYHTLQLAENFLRTGRVKMEKNEDDVFRIIDQIYKNVATIVIIFHFVLI